MAGGWTPEEAKALVAIWGAEDVQSQLDGVSRNRCVYDKIAAAMKDTGFHRTWQQCKTKVKNLTQRYRKVSVIQIEYYAGMSGFVCMLLKSFLFLLR